MCVFCELRQAAYAYVGENSEGMSPEKALCLKLNCMQAAYIVTMRVLSSDMQRDEVRSLTRHVTLDIMERVTVEVEDFVNLADQDVEDISKHLLRFGTIANSLVDNAADLGKCDIIH